MFYRKHKRRFALHSDDVVTKQSHKDECDINRILRQYQRTGIITHVSARRADFVDLPDGMDFQAAVHLVMEAERVFGGLPAKVRDHFHNDPARFLGAFQDPTQREALEGFGLVKKAPPPELPAQSPAAP